MGKTIVSLAAVEKLFEHQKAKYVLVIAPSSSAWQWADRISEFTTSSAVLSKWDKPNTRLYKPKPCTYHVVSWHLFRRDFAKISKVKWDIVIADEAQEIKNYATKTAKLIKRLSVKVRPTYRWALTGTAISTNLEELFSIMYWVDPKFLPPWPLFAENHIVRNPLGVVYQYKNLDQLNKYLQNKMDRKTHADQKDKMPALLPPIIHKIEADSAYYKSQDQLLKLLDNMATNLIFDSEGNVTGVQRDSKVAKAFHEVKSQLASAAKLHYAQQLCDRILKENSGNKIVLFSFYKEPLYKLHKLLGLKSILFTGDQSPDEKQRNVKEFLSQTGPRILLCSNAGATGLDLWNANYVIHLDVPPSHGILDQRNKRITRASSVHRTAIVHFLILEDSIEEFYYVIVLARGKLADGALDGRNDRVTVRPSSLRAFTRGED